MPDNLSSLLFEHPLPLDRGLLWSDTEEVRGDQARAAALALADELRAAGVVPGRAVAVRMPNGPAAVVAMMAVWRAGAVLVPVNPRLSVPETEAVHAALGPAAGSAPRGSPTSGRAELRPGVAFVLWTSGTTGAPKPILHTHGGYLELLDRMLGPLRARTASPARPPTPNLIPVSLSLNAGIYNALFGLRAGAPLVIMDGFECHDLRPAGAALRDPLDRPAAGRAGHAGRRRPRCATYDRSRYVRSITAPLSALQARRFTDKFGVFVLNGYGQAEIGEVIGWTAADARAHPDKVGAVGRPHPGVEVGCVDRRVAPAAGEMGELLVRPPSMAAGYASGDELADRVDPEGTCTPATWPASTPRGSSGWRAGWAI